MAGTRRRSRARDTTNANLHQRSVSQVASFAPETAIPTKPKLIEISESVDEDSLRPGSPARPETPVSRSTTAFCRNCDTKVGEFYNSWNKTTSDNYSPALLGSYRSLLRKSDRITEALDETNLAECTVDLTNCPGCGDCLGYIVVDAPAAFERCRDREFFKLQRIELRCESSSNKTIAVEPQEYTVTGLEGFEASTTPSPDLDNTTTHTMDLATPLSSSHPLWTQSTHAEPQRLHQQMHPMKSPGQPNHSDGPQPLAAISRSPTGQSGATLATGPVTMPPSVSPPPAQPRPVSAIGSSTKDPHANSVVRDQKNEYSYPREPHKVYFDAIERLQIQTAQNTSALAAQARNQIDYTELVRQTEGSLRHEFQTQLHRQDQELRRMDEVVGRLLQELQDCRRSIVSLAQRVEITQRPGEATQPGYQDEALELMARRIGEVSHRTTDLETLRDHMAIVSGRVQRLESESAAAHSSHSRPVLPTYQPAHSAHVAHAIAPHTTHVAPFQTPSRPTSNPQLMSHNEKPPTVVPPESVQRHESTPVQNGWTTVNAGTKRAHENGTNSPIQGENSAQGSPKRLRLATGESQEAQAVAQIPPGPPHILPSQTQIVVTSQSQSQSQPGLGQHQGMYPLPSPRAYTPYGIQDGPSEQSWRSESQRVPERPARGRGSRGGRGPGSRGGRVRKSMQGQHHPTGSPDWERDSWSAVPDTQGSPIVIDDHSPARSIMRRGGGGGGMRGGSSLMERVNDWTPEAGPRSVFHDPPSETKKTRSKPVRNEDGILVRKDGRPDRRSQSSAANLRKVHARKEEQNREGEAGSTPSSLQFSILAGPDTPSPASNGYQEHNVTDRVRKKHEDILGRIFPDGIDTSRKQNDYAHQVFNEDRDHTAHPRARSSRSAKTPPQIKKEHVERSEIAETQITTNGDVRMNDAGSPANGHTQGSASTPADGPAEHRSLQERTGRTRSEQESEVQIPETQALESSAALAAESV